MVVWPCREGWAADGSQGVCAPACVSNAPPSLHSPSCPSGLGVEGLPLVLPGARPPTGTLPPQVAPLSWISPSLCLPLSREASPLSADLQVPPQSSPLLLNTLQIDPCSHL